MKKILSVVVILMTSFLCACGTSVDVPHEPVLNENGKEEIELGILFVGMTLQESIVEYNKQSTRYEIVVREADKEDADLFRDHIQADISTGQGPDILALNALQNLNMEPFAEKGALMDVTDFIAEQDNLIESVTAVNTVNDRIYGVPYYFAINTMVIPQSMHVDKEAWTPECCMEVTENNRISVFNQAPGGWTKEEAGLYVLQALGVGDDTTPFIDAEQGSSSFEREEFIDMLEFSKKYADPISRESLQDRIAAGEVAYATGSIFSFRDFWFYHELFGGEPNYIGYPGPEGGRCKLLVNSFYINNASTHKEGALDFLQFLLSEEQQRKFVEQGLGFCVNRNLLKTVWKEAEQEILDEGSTHIVSGVEFDARLMTAQEEEIFWDMLEDAVPDHYTTDVWEIIWEDAMPFFTGEKTAREVAQIIDNRVQTYLDERK